MKKSILLLISIIAILYGGNIDFNNKKDGYYLYDNQESGFSFTHTIKNLNFNEVDTEKGKFTDIWFEGSTISGTPGEPNLPIFSTLFTAPMGSEIDFVVETLSSKDLGTKESGIDYPIMPAQPSYPKNIDPKDIKFYYDNEFYKNSNFSKKALVDIEKMGTMRGNDIYRMIVSPIDYSPSKSLLRVVDNMNIKVSFKGITEESVREANSKRSPYFEDILKIAINYRENNKAVDMPTSYLLVAPENLASNNDLKRFIAWKQQKGFNVVTNFISPSATVESIDSWVEDQYENLDPAPSFILLVGDMDGEYIVPTKLYNIGGASVSDLIYGVMGVPSTYNHVKSIYVGRFSVRSLDDLKNQVDKTIWYEKEQFTTGFDLSYLKKAMGVAGYDANFTYTHGNPHIKYQMTYYFNDTYVNPTTGETNGMEGLQYLNGAVGFESEIINNVSNGLAFYNYTAHGFVSGFGDPSFTNSDINSLSNEGKYGLIIGNCCLTGSFGSMECFGEAWLNAKDKGSIGYIGASESTYWSEDLAFGVGTVSTGNTTPAYSPTQMGSVDAVMLMEYPTTGGILQAGLLSVDRMNGAIWYYWNMYHLFGDPSVNLFMGEPELIPVVVTPSTINATESSTINISTGIDGALVGIYKRGELSDSKITDSEGMASFTVSPQYSGTMYVTVSAPQKQTFQGEIAVNGSQSSPLIINSSNINEEIYWEEPITHNISIQNSGTTTQEINGIAEIENSVGNILSFYNLTEISGYEKMYGLADAGEYIWVSSAGKTSSNDENMFLKFDKYGNIISELSQQTESRKGVYSIIYRDGYIYGGDNDGFYKFDETTGEVTTLFEELSNGSKNLKNLTWMGDYFLTLNSSEGFLKFDESGNVLETYAKPEINISTTDIAYCQESNTIWIFAKTGNPASKIYEYSVEDQTLTGRVAQIKMIDGQYTQKSAGIYLTNPSGGKLIANMLLNNGDSYHFAKAPIEDNWLTVEGDISGVIEPNESLDFSIVLNSIGMESNETREAKITFLNNFDPIELNITLGSMGSDIEEGLVEVFTLNGNYPNPFNPETNISFNLPSSGDINFTVYNAKGELIKNQKLKAAPAGENKIRFDASRYNSGVYFYSIRFNGFVKSGKMLLVK
ncbi:MAG: hypothetical protein CR982_01255 [Candidatus Cloacimonadota bacterium]|nr:MAG: hypothetical protein CR982_01255 [Candidatus Cloacimonadota bacterium]PIE77935.1 MAG: hypothetical protein CSA15_10335 [Candidatus Delongbacteria bacterium]